MGKSCKLVVTCPAPPVAARLTDVLNENLQGFDPDDCTIEDDRITISISPYLFGRLLIDW